MLKQVLDIIKTISKNKKHIHGSMRMADHEIRRNFSDEQAKQADIPAAHWVTLWEERLYIHIPISPVIITNQKGITETAKYLNKNI